MENLMDHQVLMAILQFAILLVVLKALSMMFKIIRKKREIGIGVTFLQSALQAFIAIYSVIQILEPFFTGKGDLMSGLIKASPFIAVVLGFILQESLANILQGLVLILFKPFQIGSRIRLVNSNISGIVTDINLNNTMIQNLFTSAVIIVPNSVIAKEVIENFHYDNILHKYYLDIQISYNSDIDHAIELIKDIVSRYSTDSRTREEIQQGVEEVQVLVQKLDINGVNLRCPVYSKEISDNFIACSNIRHDIVKEFRDQNIRMPYSQDVKIINLKEEPIQ
ncbi:MAG TPA: mechanosensitive ion channel [Candidatus Merdenecus merdavium]|nr:mechanosensitive ion channel [Candidatus Merdenecus merdavium]